MLSVSWKGASTIGLNDRHTPVTIKQSVLVVEDDEDIRELVSYHLLKEGYQVAVVPSGEEALRMAQAQPPDVILLDLMLPGIDGLAVCRELKSNPQTTGIVIVMLTAKGEETDIVTGLNMGANDYVTKPFSPKVLIARIRAALRHPAADSGGRVRRRSAQAAQHRHPCGAARGAGRWGADRA